ncbi:MAG: TlpA family protein disulfide reductase [Anaerolineales bacterium]|uniref:TlpA family protein disulfide reductase n=1 Tax=Promineifilum sp. TaxID=2664178 RepID=UPI001DD7A7FB|nr:TlpA family protein disulfide reductase [Anaerolineales bacterium]MCB8934459.1 TlpA family protein disulfide reductase [Promineifilum sp.]MCO5179971.1 TlpA family protein disulfide reductase [Promineifilum sp.]
MTEPQDTQSSPPSGDAPVPRVLLLVFGLAALALAGALLVYAYGRFSDRAAGDETAALQSIPAFSGTAESGVAGVGGLADDLPQAGDPAPDFELPTRDGATLRLSDYRGRPVILNFWATWCAPCRLEMPELQRAQAEFDAAEADGPIILTINQGDSAERVDEFFAEVDLTLAALLDGDGDVGVTYGAFFLPTTVIIGADGTVTAIHRGMISRDQLDGYLVDMSPTQGS